MFAQTDLRRVQHADTGRFQGTGRGDDEGQAIDVDDEPVDTLQPHRAPVSASTYKLYELYQIKQAAMKDRAVPKKKSTVCEARAAAQLAAVNRYLLLAACC